MKILCLHGKGTSASILEKQTAAFRRHLRALEPETRIVFDFIDGPLSADPAPAIDKFFAGPFYSFYPSASIDNLRSVHTWLLKVLEKQGPYDGVLAFSQGCALAATLMLEIQAASKAQPFKFAVLICGGVPLSYLAGKGYKVEEEAKQYDEQARLALSSQASLDALLQNGSQRWTQNFTPLSHHHSNSQQSPPAIIFGLDIAQVADVHKIPIPTVHIYGNRDPRMGSALQLAGMCRPDKTRIACHSGGHDIPRTSEVSDMIARLILWAMTENEKE
ncbi:uncharacterized protein M437DRAFT_69269 [Aureobasidium melanogenum CBS 110374]|uniref:Serine hydrolase domain-containing protein n=1 Tax=Aureobasidium melanogenum (strain CBS 110374) TaxID=1043003 RepID=A0A074VFK9_AURM1|nr:uncharacterized protein M437DRAFT_69269 [Aureobasidium melanogenum CBS 110374]KEQ59238.1 hypothetical protein M437DRAFT_69269 [Aureobasidium melanogenum CBS 110374]